MVKKEELHQYFKNNASKPREVVIKDVVNKFGINQDDAGEFYTKWRSEFMKALKSNGKSKDVMVEQISNLPQEEISKKESQINLLKPVNMVGSYGNYTFDEKGVKIAAFDEYLSKNKTEEALEALEIWEEYYGNADAKGGNL